MDRFAGFYHWNDAQCLDQAVSIARRHAIDLVRVEAWSKREGAAAKFYQFRERLNQAR